MATHREAFEYTATGVLGDQRAPMLNNELHLRSELAKPKRHGYTSYPGENYCYGMPYPPKDIGVAESLRWTTGSASHPKDRSVSGTKSGKSQQHAATFDSNMVFGKPVRPSTPIGEVLEFKFQDEWIEQQRQQQQSKKQEEQAKKIPPGVFRENRTSQLRRTLAFPKVDDGELWHMPKFSKAQPQLDTFRSEAARDKAYKNRPVAFVA